MGSTDAPSSAHRALKLSGSIRCHLCIEALSDGPHARVNQRCQDQVFKEGFDPACGARSVKACAC